MTRLISARFYGLNNKIIFQCFLGNLPHLGYSDFYNTVIIHYLQLGCRKKGCKKIICFSRNVAIQLLPHFSSRCCTVMAISNISAWNFVIKNAGNFFNACRIIHYPNGVLNTIFGCKIIYSRFRIYPFVDQRIERLNIPISKKHISSLSTGSLNMVNSVKLFIGPGKFMFL